MTNSTPAIPFTARPPFDLAPGRPSTLRGGLIWPLTSLGTMGELSGDLFWEAAPATAEVRRAPIGPGLWPGPRRQARRAGRDTPGLCLSSGAGKFHAV